MHMIIDHIEVKSERANVQVFSLVHRKVKYELQPSICFMPKNTLKMKNHQPQRPRTHRSRWQLNTCEARATFALRIKLL